MPEASLSALHALIQRFTRFGVVGASGSGLNLSCFWLLTSSLHAPPLLAATLSFEVAMCSNYLLNHRWTFADRHVAHSTAVAAFARYQIVSLGGLVLNLLVLHALADGAGVMPMLANGTGIAVAMFWNFALSVLWAWRPQPALPSIARRSDSVAFST